MVPNNRNAAAIAAKLILYINIDVLTVSDSGASKLINGVRIAFVRIRNTPPNTTEIPLYCIIFFIPELENYAHSWQKHSSSFTSSLALALC